MAKISDKIRQVVSKNKRRYQDDNYDLDLTYIKQNLIAMGFPADKLEGVYRNRMEDVVRFLEAKHKDRYKVYNLCSERSYDVAKFHSRVAHYPFDDHNPPRIELIPTFCEDVDAWLAKDPDNVAVIHCKAGKGRTGVMICAYLLHRQVKSNAADALKFYDETRTSDHKGVTIPSQRRYVAYYDQLLKARHQLKPQMYEEKTLLLKGMRFHTIPHHINLSPQIVIWKTSSSSDSAITKIYESLPVTNISKFDNDMCFEFSEKIPISGDTLIAVFNKPLLLPRKERMFQFWFNTYFVTEKGTLTSTRNGSDSDELSCKMADNPKYNTGESSRIRRTLSNQTELSSKRSVRAAGSFTFDVTKCFVLRLTKSELDKANKDRSHKFFAPNFQVVCYFEKEVKLSSVMPAGGAERGPLSEPTLSQEYDLVEENLSDTDTDGETDTPTSGHAV